MKFVLVVVWFGFPQQQQAPDFSGIAWRQPLGVAMQQFDDKDACEAQAKRLASPYLDAKCSPMRSVPSGSSADPLHADPTECRPFADDLAGRPR